MLDLTSAVHVLMKILPYEDGRLSDLQDKGPQEQRNELSQQIRKEIFFVTLVFKAQSSINSCKLLEALQALTWEDEMAA